MGPHLQNSNKNAGYHHRLCCQTYINNICTILAQSRVQEMLVSFIPQVKSVGTRGSLSMRKKCENHLLNFPVEKTPNFNGVFWGYTVIAQEHDYSRSILCYQRMCLLSDSGASKLKMWQNRRVSKPEVLMEARSTHSMLKVPKFTSPSCDTRPATRPSAVPLVARLCFSGIFQSLTGQLHPIQSDRTG